MDEAMDLSKPNTDPTRRCSANARCERCRDCGYTHIGIACPDPASDFDGTCLCDPTSTKVA
jgi:hypothetical protein